MKLNRVIPLFVTLFFAVSNANAKLDKDVNVVNTPTVNVGNAVTIDNADVPATIKNTPANPVPVTPVGKQPYNFFYNLTALPGTIDSCQAIPVPEGEVLTIKTIGVYAEIDSAMKPDVSLRITYDNHTAYYGGAVNLINSSTENTYHGIYRLSVPVGNIDDSGTYHAAICVTGPAAEASIYNSARGTVSGYVEATTLVDGNSLP